MGSKTISVEKKYNALRTIAGLYQIGGWLIIIGAGLLSVGAVLNSTSYNIITSILAALPIVISIIIVGVSLLAFSQFIHVFLSIEENTRLNTQVQMEILRVQRALYARATKENNL